MRANVRIVFLYGLVALIPLVSISSGQGKGKGGGGGEDEGYGNNLSVPAIFGEGIGITGYPTSTSNGLRPLPGEAPAPFFDPTATFLKDGVAYYPQQTTSTWVAGWRNGLAGGERVIVNWSDNLVKQRWTPRSTIRVETVLYQNGPESMKSYLMTLLYGSGTTEMWGARGEGFTAYIPYRTVFSANAALRIEKIGAPGASVMAKPVTPTLPFESAVYQRFGVDGPGAYGAEVNVSGNLIYGFNWMLNQWNIPDTEKLGWWRITFKILPTVTYNLGGAVQVVNRNVYLDSLDLADTVSTVLFKPVLRNNMESYIDIEIVANRSGGGGKP